MNTAADISNITSEAGVIATLLHHPEYILYSDNLKPNHFTDVDNRCIYSAIMNLVQRGISTIDPYNILEELSSSEKTRKISDNITVDKLSELFDMSTILARGSIQEYKLLVSNILNAAFRRDMFDRLKECEAKLLDDTQENVKQQIYSIVDEVMTEYSTMEDMPEYKDVVDDMWEEIKNRHGSGYAGIPFKFPALNDYATIERGELVIFGAQQKVGKSIMLLNCAVDLLKQGYAVLYIDSELSTRLFTARLLSYLSGVEYRRLTSGNYSQEEEQDIMGAMEWIKTREFTHVYMPFFDQESIYTAAKKLYHAGKLDVIIVDYFKSTGNATDAYQTYAEMGRCVDLVKNEIAGDMNIAAIGAAQATANNKLADSAKIARNASTIIMLIDKTPEEIDADGTECGNKKMVVTVNRNGMQHVPGEYIDLQFDGNHIRYEQAKQHTPETPY